MQLDGNFGLFSKNDKNREAELSVFGLPDTFEGPIGVLDLHVLAAGALRAAEAKRNIGDKSNETLKQIEQVRGLYSTIEEHIIRSLRVANIVTTTEAIEDIPEAQ